MFNPSKFKQEDFQEVRSFIGNHPFATIVHYSQKNGLDAAHIPVYWADNGTEWGCLRGHFALANSIWKHEPDENQYLFIFQNAGHYITPNYYPGKQQHHKAVPTWNFQVVHAKGSLKLIREVEQLKTILATQTAQFESQSEQGWQLSDAPAEYIEKECKGIMGFELMIEHWEAKYKLSQNQNAENRQGVIEGLRKLDTPASCHMAALVEQFNPK